MEGGMRFTKMHGAGNDYIYLDAFTETVPEDFSRLAAAMSDRHTGAGADGVIVIGPSRVAEARMRIWNADGTPAEMCGNGLRCVAKYLFDRRMVAGPEFAVETDAGVKAVQVEAEAGFARRVRVSMGSPVLDSASIPTKLTGNPPLNVSLDIGGRQVWASCVSMGNPHVVVIVEELCDDWVLKIGPRIERHPRFPNRTNVEFVTVLSREEIALRVWERGAGETLACGTGACAAVVACKLLNHTEPKVRCRLPGGVLDVDWNTDDNQVYLTGPAVEVFEGIWPIESAAGR